MAGICSTFYEAATLLSKAVVPSFFFFFLPSIPFPTFGVVLLFRFSHSNTYVMMSLLLALICFSLMTNDVEQLFHVFICCLYVFFWKSDCPNLLVTS